ncbi:MAG TPA: AbrB family transcriptional regulator [Stellaceae bacterium]|nr:AbrB family transcriptional regulator [Stellaceae bacterium]
MRLPGAAVLGRWAAGLAGGAAAGYAMRALHLPLPWLIGPLLAMAALRLIAAPADPVPGGRQAGQAVIGLAVGLYFTAEVLGELAGHAAAMLLACCATLLLGAMTALLLARLGGVDLKTAYFCAMPAGAAEMAVLGERHGAAPAPIALAQSLRIAAIVLTVPPAVSAIGGSGGGLAYAPALSAVIWPLLLAMLAAAGVVSWVFARLRLNNAWLLGSLATGIAIAALALPLSAVPGWLVAVAQVLLGIALGARFDRAFLMAAPRFSLAAVLCALIMVALCAIMGTGLARLLHIPAAAAILATAPGSIGEMSVTARVLGIAVPIVTAFQLVRILIVLLFAGPFFLLCRRLGDSLAPRAGLGD